MAKFAAALVTCVEAGTSAVTWSDSTATVFRKVEAVRQSVVSDDEPEFEVNFGNLLHTFIEIDGGRVRQNQDLPVFWINIAFGTLDGLLNNNGDLLNCVFGAGTVVMDIQQFHADKGNKSAQMMDIKAIFKSIPAAFDACEPIVPEANAVLSVLKNVSSFQDLVHLIEGNFKADDKSEIFKEIEILLQSVAAEDSFAFGSNFGYLLHHLFIGSFPNATLTDRGDHAELPMFWINLIGGLADGLLNHKGDLLQCGYGLVGAFLDIVQFHDDKGNKTAQKMDIMSFIHDLPAAVDACEPVPSEVKQVITVLGNVSSFHDLGMLMERNFKADDKSVIFKEVLKLVQSFGSEDAFSFGSNLGYLLHQLLVGMFPAETNVVFV